MEGDASAPVTFVLRLREGDTWWDAAPPAAIIQLQSHTTLKFVDNTKSTKYFLLL